MSDCVVMGDYSEEMFCEEIICNECGEQKHCRRIETGNNSWICQDCLWVAQMEMQAAIDAEFACLRYRLTPKGEEALRFANMEKGTAR